MMDGGRDGPEAGASATPVNTALTRTPHPSWDQSEPWKTQRWGTVLCLRGSELWGGGVGCFAFFTWVPQGWAQAWTCLHWFLPCHLVLASGARAVALTPT